MAGSYLNGHPLSTMGVIIMKRLCIIVLVCGMLCLFAACNRNHTVYPHEPTNVPLFDATTVATSNEAGDDDIETTIMDFVQCEEGYQYGNMQKNLPPGGFMRLENEVLFEYASNGSICLYCYDLTTGEVASFCKDATCNHSSCASSRLGGNLEVYKGKLYSLTESGKIVEIKDNEKEILLNAEVNDFFHHNNKLYIRTFDSSLIVLEEGNKKPQVVIEEYTGYWNVIFGQYLYGTTSNNMIRIDLTAEERQEELIVVNGGGVTDGVHIYYIDNQTKYLYRCNMDGSDDQLLLNKPVLKASMNFDDEYFYYRLHAGSPLYEGEGSHDIYRFPKEDPARIEKFATLEAAVYQVYTAPGTGMVFVKTIAADGENRPIYVIDTDSNTTTQLEIPVH